MRARLLMVLALALLGGCEKAARNMYDGARVKPLQASTRFADGAASRTQVEGTVEHTREAPPAGPVTLATLKRGRERYDIYCAPCHSVAGDGDGMVVRRGFPRPASFHTERLRAASDQRIHDAITMGIGTMYPFADRIAPADRRAIVAYVRALQLSQDAPAESAR